MSAWSGARFPAGSAVPILKEPEEENMRVYWITEHVKQPQSVYNPQSSNAACRPRVLFARLIAIDVKKVTGGAGISNLATGSIEGLIFFTLH